MNLDVRKMRIFQIQIRRVLAAVTSLGYIIGNHFSKAMHGFAQSCKSPNRHLSSIRRRMIVKAVDSSRLEPDLSTKFINEPGL